MFRLKSVNIFLDVEENTLPGARDPIQEAVHRAGGAQSSKCSYIVCPSKSRPGPRQQPCNGKGNTTSDPRHSQGPGLLFPRRCNGTFFFAVESVNRAHSLGQKDPSTSIHSTAKGFLGGARADSTAPPSIPALRLRVHKERHFGEHVIPGER